MKHSQVICTDPQPTPSEESSKDTQAPKGRPGPLPQQSWADRHSYNLDQILALKNSQKILEAASLLHLFTALVHLEEGVDSPAYLLL